ncbi:MAG: type II secretion system F family protein [Micavibrio sp.]|nr:type II secretion system F family protein [Micavibrio sp.]
MNILQIIIIVLIAAIIMAAIIVILINKESEKKRRIKSVIQGKASLDNNSPDKNDGRDKRRADIAKKLKGAKEETEINKKKTPISLMIEQAGLSLSTKKFWVYSFISMLLFLGFAKLIGQPVFIIILFGIIGLLGVPKLILKRFAAKRQKTFLEEFPDALEATVRLLKAGMPVAGAIAMIAKEFEGPVGEEMMRIYDKQKIGIPLHDAALEGTKRMPIPEMKMFATGLSIQAQTGSSLSEVLSNLSRVIRARFKLKRKIKALASEAVASAAIIGSLPNLVALGMYFANREYIMILFETSTGNILLGVAISMMLVGIFVMRAMINFKI